MSVFNDGNHLNIYIVLGSIVLLAIIVFVRYLVFSSLYHLVFFNWFKTRFVNRFLHNKPWKKKQLKKEILWSMISGFIFALFIMLTFILNIEGYTAVYTELDEYPIWYLFVSIILVLFLQDTYYYWVHRWMHLPKIYKYFHLVHHKSIHTSVFTAFSFHPLETVLQALVIPILAILVPLHLYAIIAIITLMTISATINHAGVEVYPSGRFGAWFKKWVIGATHHDVHHKKFNYNYGLYFTFWDRWMKTEHQK
ncbi:MAG: sterol desaturase [Flavobacteriaceae bacterium]|nr:sterol desaturase [Flavobacteriaceae bacterium]|tara:strand:- start:555015 stop:555770 length:756 start_codon:yes stop_codon:yes gene_type:complete